MYFYKDIYFYFVNRIVFKYFTICFCQGSAGWLLDASSIFGSVSCSCGHHWQPSNSRKANISWSEARLMHYVNFEKWIEVKMRFRYYYFFHSEQLWNGILKSEKYPFWQKVSYWDSKVKYIYFGKKDSSQIFGHSHTKI